MYHIMATQQIPPGKFTMLPATTQMSNFWWQNCEDAYNLITKENLWPFFKNISPPDNKGYMWWGPEDPHYEEWRRVSKILDKIDNGHSGASWGCLMRTMQCIAIDGWDKYAGQQTSPPAQPAPVDASDMPRTQS